MPLSKKVVSGMKKKKRIAAMLLAVTLLFVMLYSALFIAVEAGHDCIGESCPICCQINACRDALKNLTLAVCAAAFAAALTYTLCGRVLSRAKSVRFNTLVTLSVKLSD